MSSLRIGGLPEPPEFAPLGWCFIDAARLKHTWTTQEDVARRIDAALNDGKDGTKTVSREPGEPMLPLSPAVTLGPMHPGPGAPIVPLCWTCCPGFDESAAALESRVQLDTQTRLPPGLMRRGQTNGH